MNHFSVLYEIREQKILFCKALSKWVHGLFALYIAGVKTLSLFSLRNGKVMLTFIIMTPNYFWVINLIFPINVSFLDCV